MSLWSLVLVSLLLAVQPAGAPADRVATRTGPNEVTLTWRAQSGVREYRIYSDIDGSPRPQAVGRVSGNGNRFVVTIPATFGKTGSKSTHRITFWIQMVGDGPKTSERYPFNPIEVVPSEVTHGNVNAPRRVEASAGADSVTITWDPVRDAIGYAITRQAGRAGYKMLCSQCPAETTYVDRQPLIGETNVYEVMTIAANGRSRPQRSNGVKVKPQPGAGDPKGPGGSGSRGSGPGSAGGGGGKSPQGPLAAPANARATLTKDIVHLSWTPVREARGYAISRNGQRAANLGAGAREWSEGVGRFSGELHYEIVAIGVKETSPPARFNPIVLPKIK